jgi:hypothetical protein
MNKLLVLITSTFLVAANNPDQAKSLGHTEYQEPAKEWKKLEEAVERTEPKSSVKVQQLRRSLEEKIDRVEQNEKKPPRNGAVFTTPNFAEPRTIQSVILRQYGAIEDLKIPLQDSKKTPWGTTQAECDFLRQTGRDPESSPLLRREAASPDEPLLIYAVDRREGKCPVLVMKGDTEDIREVPKTDEREGHEMLIPAKGAKAQ